MQRKIESHDLSQYNLSESLLYLCVLLGLACFVGRCEHWRLLPRHLAALLVLVLCLCCLLQLHLIQVLEVFADGLQFLVLDAYEIRHLRLHLLHFCRLTAVPPEVVHLLPLQPRVLLLPQLLHQGQDVFGHFAGPADDIVQILHFALHELVDIRPQSLQGILVGIHRHLQLLNGFLLLEHPADELLEADGHEFVLVVVVPVDLLAALVFALQAEEGVLLAALVEAHHPRLLLVHALREVLYPLQLGGRLSILLFLHSNTINNHTSKLPQALSCRVKGDDAMRYINKMNKTRSSKLTRKTQHPMRVLFKLRQNHKGVVRTIEDKSEDCDSLNLTNAINMDQSTSTFLDKRYETKQRMKTEYSDRFGSFGFGNRSFIAAKNARETQRVINQSDQTVIQDKKDTACFNNHSPDKESLQPKQKPQAELNPQAATFQSIEEKLQSLMNRRLQQCMQFKKNSDWVIDNELSKLVQAYKQIKASSGDDNQEDIQLMQRKINMLEKLIAENMVESDIAKKYYLAKVANSHWKHYKTESFSAIEPVKEVKNRQVRHQSLVNTSNNQDSYHKPQRSAYNIQKRGYYNYNPDRHMQPLPRSSYNRDFLIYGAIRHPACKPVENQTIKPASSAKLMNSSYKLSFGPKKAEKINTKQLDACRDKIKNLPVIFGKREKEAIAYNLATYFREKKKEGTSHSVDRIEPKPIPNHFITESRKEFIQATQISPSQIKHQNLQRLKYSYKKDLHM